MPRRRRRIRPAGKRDRLGHRGGLSGGDLRRALDEGLVVGSLVVNLGRRVDRAPIRGP
jgi:hypothetical protein